jgi:tRNA U34 5-methylaminomethyl-2-thiouridine-forming methyltransferase MnmC
MDAARRIVLPTQDGSHTVSIPSLGVTYHSTRGAVQEAEHVYIQTGLHKALDTFPNNELRVLEMGFGTGLNAFLTGREAEILNRNIRYTTVELYPLSRDTVDALNYPDLLGYEHLFNAIQQAPWDALSQISEQFLLHKKAGNLVSLPLEQNYHLIYYDAFAPNAQPELWTEEIFTKLNKALVSGGMLVTYCSKGSARRAMKASGFGVKKLSGPPGKWEIVRAVKF